MDMLKELEILSWTNRHKIKRALEEYKSIKDQDDLSDLCKCGSQHTCRVCRKVVCILDALFWKRIWRMKATEFTGMVIQGACRQLSIQLVVLLLFQQMIYKTTLHKSMSPPCPVFL